MDGSAMNVGALPEEPMVPGVLDLSRSPLREKWEH